MKTGHLEKWSETIQTKIVAKDFIKSTKKKFFLLRKCL